MTKSITYTLTRQPSGFHYHYEAHPWGCEKVVCRDWVERSCRSLGGNAPMWIRLRVARSGKGRKFRKMVWGARDVRMDRLYDLHFDLERSIELVMDDRAYFYVRLWVWRAGKWKEINL